MSVMPVPKLPERNEELPELENGAHLDQATFHERYDAMPEHVRAELIGGVVYMASPVGRIHSRDHKAIVMWLANFEIATPGVEALSTPTVILGNDCELQPDAALRLVNGKTSLVRRGKNQTEYIAGPPELVVEAASSSESVDAYEKLRDYQLYGVEEYVIFLVRTRRIIWFMRDAGRFVEMPSDADGILRSRIFPGLWLDSTALLSGDLSQVQRVLNRGINTPEHASFIAESAKRRS